MAMHLLKSVFFICVKFAISLVAEHPPGCLNGAADALSVEGRRLHSGGITGGSDTAATKLVVN